VEGRHPALEAELRRGVGGAELEADDDSEVWIDNPSFYPDPGSIKEAYAPYIKATIITPERYLGTVMVNPGLYLHIPFCSA